MPLVVETSMCSLESILSSVLSFEHFKFHGPKWGQHSLATDFIDGAFLNFYSTLFICYHAAFVELSCSYASPALFLLFVSLCAYMCIVP